METVSTTTVMIATTSTSGITRTSSPTIATTSTLTLLYHSLFPSLSFPFHEIRILLDQICKQVKSSRV